MNGFVVDVRHVPTVVTPHRTAAAAGMCGDRPRDEPLAVRMPADVIVRGSREVRGWVLPDSTSSDILPTRKQSVNAVVRRVAMVHVQVVSDYHRIFSAPEFGLAWLWWSDVEDVSDPLPTPVEIKPGLTGYGAISMSQVSYNTALKVLLTTGYKRMLTEDDETPVRPELPSGAGDAWIFVNDDLMPAAMDGIDEEAIRLWNEAEAALRERVLDASR
ncbi:hypothetical protein L1785_13825 [Antribacter sp. KLBMP9083]|uniref:Uncharacterized protein n=1 Tax=Antribacter soli TaxID=2910976 RepID=A0AA41U9X2_9MICO|nr:hypothetical protein [Antribacter soli]MCF4122057.1 hypothetical protein [Antribacter soli]